MSFHGQKPRRFFSLASNALIEPKRWSVQYCGARINPNIDSLSVKIAFPARKLFTASGPTHSAHAREETASPPKERGMNRKREEKLALLHVGE